MSSRSFVLRLLLVATSVAVTSVASAAPIKLGGVGGVVVTPDTKTVIVSVPADGVLRYYDAETEKELKKVEVEFQPLALALQGKSLFASTKGAAVVHVLDAATGKELKTIKIPGEPILQLACHPSKGLLYATNSADEVYAIDPEAGKATKTKARGQRIVVDPTEGKYVYTGIQKPIKDQLVVEEGQNKQLKLSLVTTGARAMMLKFAVSGKDLKLAGFQDNAALNGRSLAISPDGKRIAMAGGGGWVSKKEGRYTYGIAVFETEDMQTMAGQVELGAYPLALEFHPVLKQGVAIKSGGEVVVFNAKSLAKKSSMKVDKGEPPIAVYAAKGTKLVLVSGSPSVLEFHPLSLTDEDKEELKKAYGK